MESGLHGLGHWAMFQANMTAPIIDQFLESVQDQDTQLLRYAKAVQAEMIL